MYVDINVYWRMKGTKVSRESEDKMNSLRYHSDWLCIYVQPMCFHGNLLSLPSALFFPSRSHGVTFPSNSNSRPDTDRWLWFWDQEVPADLT